MVRRWLLCLQKWIRETISRLCWLASQRAAEWEAHFHRTGREEYQQLYWLGPDGKLYYLTEWADLRPVPEEKEQCLEAMKR